MKPSNLIIVSLVTILGNITFAQQQQESNLSDRVYLRAGIDFTNFSNVTVFRSGRNSYERGGVNLYSVSAGYKFTKRTSFELQYKYLDEFSNSYEKELYLYTSSGMKYYKYGGGVMNSHYLNLRANYFVNEDKKEDPIYFIASMGFGFQRVRNSETTEYADSTVTVTNKYTRFVVGPEAGFGIYFDLGTVGFNTEFTFSSRISPFSGDKRYAENSLTMNFSPVINF
jgi:hypothetical protein